MSNFAYTFLQIVEIFANGKFIRIFVKEFRHIWNENEFSRRPWFPWIASEENVAEEKNWDTFFISNKYLV